MQFVNEIRVVDTPTLIAMSKSFIDSEPAAYAQHHQRLSTQLGLADKLEPQQAPEAVKILLAEDNLINQKVALALLKKFGYSADVVLNGAEAVEAFAAQRYNIILMDINMPEMDGVEATQRIRASFPTEDQPYIIAVTANAMIGDREKYLASGLDAYVSKPIKPSILLEAIDQAIA